MQGRHLVAASGCLAFTALALMLPGKWDVALGFCQLDGRKRIPCYLRAASSSGVHGCLAIACSGIVLTHPSGELGPEFSYFHS